MAANTINTKRTHDIKRADAAVIHPIHELLQHTDMLTRHSGEPALRPAAAIRVQALERRAPKIVSRAHEAGVKIEYLGVNPLFAEARLYAGTDTDWVFAPVTEEKDAIVPYSERRALRALQNRVAIDFPLIYIAHEITKDKTKDITIESGRTTLAHAQASALVGPTPPPATAVKLNARLSQTAGQILTGLAYAVPIVAGVTAAAAVAVVAAPVALIAGLAMIDPIVIGAIPATSPEAGEMAAWFVLARWMW